MSRFHPRRVLGLGRRARHALDRWDLWTRSPMGVEPPDRRARWCTVCRWHGKEFGGDEHCESQVCPRCGSVARDRFLLYAFTSRHPASGDARLRVLETSPRLGERYRSAMRRWFSYSASDYDLRGHRGELQLDLQDIHLPSGSLDVVLSAHVLEHVPDTGTALAELHRVLAPAGRLYLQVPLTQGRTAPPPTPEFHGDDTPVHWRFGWDLIDRLEDVGFSTTPLVAPGFSATDATREPVRGEFQVADLVEHAPLDALVELGGARAATQMGWRPAFQHVAFEAVKAA